jgi:hypothetical protein
MSNTDGSYKITGSRNMLAYDMLPPVLREVHRNCIFDFAVPPHLTRLKKGEKASSLADQLMHVDVDEARSDAKRDWKKQAADYLAAQRPRRRRDWLDKPPRSRL